MLIAAPAHAVKACRVMGPSLKVNKHGLVELNISASSAAELPTDLYNFIRVEGWYILLTHKLRSPVQSSVTTSFWDSISFYWNIFIACSLGQPGV